MGFRLFHKTDRGLYRVIHRRMRAKSLDPLMVGSTNLGTKSTAWFAICAGMTFFGGRRARRAAAITIASTLTAQGIVNLILKPLIRRERPYRKRRLARLLVSPPQEHSWPSAHAASSAAALTVLAASYPEFSIPVAVLASAISYSRVYVGVHYPFDVAAGTAIGLGVGAVWLKATQPARSLAAD